MANTSDMFKQLGGGKRRVDDEPAVSEIPTTPSKKMTPEELARLLNSFVSDLDETNRPK